MSRKRSLTFDAGWSCAVVCGLLVVFVAAGCDDDAPKTNEGSCPNSTQVEQMQGHSFCVMSDSITETGVRCPEAMPYMHEIEEFNVCADSGDLPDGLLGELIDTCSRGPDGQCPDDSVSLDSCEDNGGSVVCTHITTGQLCEQFAIDTGDPECECRCQIGPSAGFGFVHLWDGSQPYAPQEKGGYPGTDVDAVLLIKADGTEIPATSIAWAQNPAPTNLSSDPEQLLGPPDQDCTTARGFYSLGGGADTPNEGQVVVSFGGAVIQNGDAIRVVAATCDLGYPVCTGQEEERGGCESGRMVLGLSVDGDAGDDRQSFMQLGEFRVLRPEDIPVSGYP